MKIFKKSLVSLFALLAIAGTSMATDYGLPADIQQGNILHCFNWTANEIKAELPNIAAAGFGSVQMSPLQRSDIGTNSAWHNLYRPYDLAFKSSSFCTEQQLKELCEAAATYGIKVIVDVVANHVDKTSGYHDTWWDSNNRVRWEGGINYDSRYSITHGQLGDYGDINSELSEVCQRGKTYVEKLKSLGVKGIRWDAAKHIGLPSESCNFWSTVTSVPGMYHYGEILDAPGPNPSIIKEYTNYMSVTDNRYCNYAASQNGGIPGGYGGDWAVNQQVSDTKLVYWAESHDTYANDEWSQNVDQSVIDRAYAAYACRNGATALYLARPNTKGFNNIKIGKGSTAFKNKHIAEVNKFRNLMTGKKDYFTGTGNACSITREGGGAVIVMKGSGNISIANGGGYCPAGTYVDKVSGNTFNVTASTISGNVGSSGIAVLIKDGVTPDPNPNPDPNPDQNPDPDPNPDFNDLPVIDGVYLKNTANWSEPYAWAWNSTSNCTQSGNWPGDKMTKYNNTYWKWEVPAGMSQPAEIIFNPGGDEGKTADLTYKKGGVYDCNGTLLGTVSNNPGPDPGPNPTDFTIYYDNSNTKWSKVMIHYWSNPSTEWPGVDMTKVNDNVWKFTFPSNPSALDGFLFHNGNGDQTADYTHAPINNHIYKGNGGKGAVTDEGEYSDGPQPEKPVVTANPASGTYFDNSVTVTLTVSPAATIYYTVNGSTPTTSSTKYTSPLVFESTTTLKTLAVTSAGGKNEQTFKYTKKSDNPNPPTPGTNLITNYYKVNPDQKVGRNRTVNMSFANGKSTTALSNWTDQDLIAQGVGRDVCQAFKGLHERPFIDSYAIYASYDDQNLYLGVQFVYSVWDAGGEGKQPGESKPYNMDGRILWAFDLDPEAKFDGYINGTYAIWNQEGAPGVKYDNGVDAVWLGSTKPGNGTPGFFVPTPDGHASYDPQYCKSSTVSYGYADGLLPSIDKIWAQPLVWGATPEPLTGNDGWIDMRSEITDSAHTFYEFKFPLSLLGISKDYIENTGIGVQYIDVYGSSGTGGIPYDPEFFDKATQSYSQDPSSSKEKEDEDLLKYSPARIGKMGSTTGNNIIMNIDSSSDSAPVYFNLQGVRVDNPEAGVYIVRRGNKVTKEVIR